jgi:hypothetical protein
LNVTNFVTSTSNDELDMIGINLKDVGLGRFWIETWSEATTCN